MQIGLGATNHVLFQLRNEVSTLENMCLGVSESLIAEIKEMINVRVAAINGLEAMVQAITVTVPVDAEVFVMKLLPPAP